MPGTTINSETWAIVMPSETLRAALMFDKLYRIPDCDNIVTAFTFPGESKILARQMFEDTFIGPQAKTNWRPPDEVSFGTSEDDALFRKVWGHLGIQVMRAYGGGKPELDPTIVTRTVEQ